jgi:hypothetical protein
MNEVALHRGRHPHLTVVDAFFNGQHLTEAVVSLATQNEPDIRPMVCYYPHQRVPLPTLCRLGDQLRIRS